MNQNKRKSDDDITSVLVEVEDPGKREYIEDHLVRFIHLLRHLGLRISSAEAVDAMRALAMVDIMKPVDVKAALKATLAKNPESRLVFDKAFASYFVPPEDKERREELRREAQEKEAADLAALEEELVYRLESDDPEESKDVKINLTEEEKKTFLKLPEEKKQKIRDYLKKPTKRNQINNPEQLIENMVRSSLNYWKHYLKHQSELPPEVEYTGDEEFDAILDEVAENLRGEEELFYQDIQNITERDMPTAAALIARLSRQLATRISRRYQRSKKRERLDLRRTIRQNVRLGGTLFNLKYRTKKVQKPKIMLICDVSGSMAKYAGFVLQFIYGLSSAVEEIESFIFSEDLARVTPYFEKNLSFDAVMPEIINKSKDWGKGTDFGKALDIILGKYKPLLKKDTFIIIVSDTKTLTPEKASPKLGLLQKLTREVVWLNTMPRKFWADTRSVALFRKYSRMFECNTLAHLDKIMRTEMLH